MRLTKNITNHHSTGETPIFILAGGYGTRISEESQFKPKPMIEIGGIPILVHIMRSYYARGFRDFVILGGYNCADIKRYFLQYRYLLGDLDVDLRFGSEKVSLLDHGPKPEKWRVRVLDTGLSTMTGARLQKGIERICHEQAFSHFGLTYGDGLTDANLREEFEFHLAHKGMGTVLGVKNLARYGELDVSETDTVSGFLEKPQMRQGFISGGFFFFKTEFKKFLTGDDSLVLEKEPLSQLAQQGGLKIYRHEGFWHAMDTLRDKNHLQGLWDSGNAPWKIKEPQGDLCLVPPSLPARRAS